MLPLPARPSWCFRMVHGLLLDPFKESFVVSSGVSGSGGQTSSAAPGQAQSAQAQHHQQEQQQVANMVRELLARPPAREGPVAAH